MTGWPDMSLLVMAKAPRPGAVKTRLAVDLGELGAAKVAAAALLDTLQVAGGVFSVRVLALAGDLTDSGDVDCSEILRETGDWQVIGQSSGDFGHRLAQAHQEAATMNRGSDGATRRVLQIGMDTPQVSAAQLEDSARELCESDVDAILGAALDGGWWVCGTSTADQAAALAEVPMSRSDTGSLTLAALRGVGARVRSVCALRDLDTLDDARAISAQHSGLHVSEELRSQGIG